MKKLHLAYYITAHGYGHGVRSCDILGAVMTAHPGVRVTVTTDLPESFLRSRLPYANLAIRPGAFDVGMVQKDSIRVDVAATLTQALELVEERPNLIDYEAEMLRGESADLVVADIPSIPIEAAAEAGIPAVAVGNFSWDWIYAPFVVRDPRWRNVIQLFEEGYRQAKLLLKLPFSPQMACISPCRTSRLTSSRALTPGNILVIFFMARSSCATVVPPAEGLSAIRPVTAVPHPIAGSLLHHAFPDRIVFLVEACLEKILVIGYIDGGYRIGIRGNDLHSVVVGRRVVYRNFRSLDHRVHH